MFAILPAKYGLVRSFGAETTPPMPNTFDGGTTTEVVPTFAAEAPLTSNTAAVPLNETATNCHCFALIARDEGIVYVAAFGEPYAVKAPRSMDQYVVEPAATTTGPLLGPEELG
jgi:hypothetical protein